MYGLIVKLTAVPGKRCELIRILSESASEMQGCLRYVVAQDSAEENAIWVTAVWDSVRSHDASFVTGREERNPSSQSHRYEFREDRGHHSNLGSRT